MKNLKIAGKLRKFTELRPIQRNETRWSSTFEMVSRFLEIHSLVSPTDFYDDPSLSDFVPSHLHEISTLHVTLQKLDSITKSLQKADLDLAEVRFLFDHAILEFPVLDEYCGPNSKIYHSPFFEKAVVKILNGDEKSLTTEEAQSVQKLKKQVVEQPEGSNSQGSDSDFASLLIKKRRLQLSSQKVSESKIFTAYFEYSGTVF